MRSLLRTLLLAFVLGATFPVVVDAQKPLPKYGVGEPNVRVRQFGPGVQRPDPIRWTRIAVVGGVFGVCALLMLTWYRRQSSGVGLAKDEAELAARGGGRAAGAGVSPLESVFAAITRAGGWVTPGRVAMSAGIDAGDVEDHLQSLVRGGRVKAGRDKRGRVLYRIPE